MAHHTAQHLPREMQDCIDECQHCHATCLATVRHCLELGGPHAEARHITLMLDCAEICATSANFMLRGSAQHGRTCAICATVCRLCAEDCERIDRDDPMMKECAEACRRCADFCEQMAH
jgi:hypothetical protein